MILGLTLLTANLRGFLETIVVYILFFWERKSMRALLRKNLIAHKQTNKLTSIIYALTLGCIIFLCVSLNLLLKSINNLSVSMPGSDIFVEEYYRNYLNATSVDPILQEYQSDIKTFGWLTDSRWSMYDRKNSTRKTIFKDTGR